MPCKHLLVGSGVTGYKLWSFFVDTEELGTKELVFGEKKFYVDAKSNEQGQFMRIVEVSETAHEA